VSTLCPVLSGIDIPEKLLVSVVPNPSTGIFRLTPSKEHGIVEIYNILGKRIYRSEFNGQGSTIDMTSQPSGIYIAKFYSGEKVYTSKLVIQ
jgi:hypothetical protein